MSNRSFLVLAIATAVILGIILCFSAWFRSNGWTPFVSSKVLPIEPSMKDEDIRKVLLTYTPLGSDEVTVSQFINNSLRPRGVTHLTAKDGSQDSLFVYLGSYSATGFVWKIEANWKFGSDGKLFDLEIGRDNSP